MKGPGGYGDLLCDRIAPPGVVSNVHTGTRMTMHTKFQCVRFCRPRRRVTRYISTCVGSLHPIPDPCLMSKRLSRGTGTKEGIFSGLGYNSYRGNPFCASLGVRQVNRSIRFRGK